MYRKNEEIEVRITDLTREGEGIGKTGAFPWFVKDAVPGDLVRASVMKTKKTYGYARLQEILEASPDRVPAPCPKARACGGCTLQCMSYEAQLRFKQELVQGSLTRISGFDRETLPMEPILGMDDPRRSRCKAVIPVGRNKEGRAVSGFYAGHTHSIVECDDCLAGPEENRVIMDVVKNQYDDALRNVLIRKSCSEGGSLVCLVSRSRRPLRGLCSSLMELDCVTTVVQNYNPDDTNVILGRETAVLAGPGYIEDSIEDLRFRISAQSFYQVNPRQTRVLYGKALEYAGLSGSETVWDLYCGIGTISLFLARQAGQVFGVEVIPQAVEDARENARRNGISNAEFFTGKAEEVLPAWFAEHGQRPDVIVVDPPRKGLHSECLHTMLSMAPRRIVYVSCDPATLARDLKLLCAGGYELKKVQPVDMFPWSTHIETVVLLGRENANHTGKYFSNLMALPEPDSYLRIDLDTTILEKNTGASATYQEIKDYSYIKNRSLWGTVYEAKNS